MKQKIEKINWCILIFTFGVEIIFLNMALKECGVSIYSNPANWIRNIVINISLDIIYILYILDLVNRENKVKNILKTYKKDVNLKFIKNFIILEIIKPIIILGSIGETVFDFKNRYTSIIETYIISIVVFYVLYIVLPKRDNLKRKIKKLKKDVEKGKTDFSFILIDGNYTPSSFNLINIPEYKTAKNNIYINLNKELPEIEKNMPKAKQLIIDNTIAVIHELENAKIQNILEVYEKQTINNIHMYHVMAIKNLKDKPDLTNLEYINSIKICNLEDAVEYTENLFVIDYEDFIKKSRYKKALKYVKKEIKDEEKYMQSLETIYKYNFNNRLKNNIEIIPEEKYIFELYRNALLNSSPYQSILTFFNYITVIGKLVEYYLYAKNNPKYSKNEINRYIIKDNPPIWNNHILLNIYKNPENTLYKNLREKEFEISDDEKILLKFYLSKILNININGDKITYDGLMQLLIDFRNKVEAHGIINDANVYAVWNLTYFFVKMLNKMFKISELECEYDMKNNDVKVGYKGEKKISLGKYVIIQDNFMCFIKEDDKYINYFAGEFKPSFVKKEGKNK